MNKGIFPLLIFVHIPMLFGGCKVTMNMAYASVPCWIREIRGHLITQEIYNEAVRIEPRSLAFVPDHFKTEEM